MRRAAPIYQFRLFALFVLLYPHADRNRITFRGFPEWLYDDNPWNDYLHLTTNDSNYWDNMHYRVAIATPLARQLAGAALEGQESLDGSYRILVR
jgi:hypothetical protein